MDKEEIERLNRVGAIIASKNKSLGLYEFGNNWVYNVPEGRMIFSPATNLNHTAIVCRELMELMEEGYDWKIWTICDKDIIVVRLYYPKMRMAPRMHMDISAPIDQIGKAVLLAVERGVEIWKNYSGVYIISVPLHPKHD